MNESEERRRMLIQNARAQSAHYTYSFPRQERGEAEEYESSGFRTRLLLSILCFLCFVAFDSAELEVAKVNSDVIMQQIETNLTMDSLETMFEK